MRRSVPTLLVVSLVLGIAAEARGQTAPPRPGLTLPHGKVALTVTVEANLSENAGLEPVSLAPDLSYGVADGVTIALIHSGAGTTGFRGAAGAGLCLGGEDRGCAVPYRSVGGEVLGRLSNGPVALAANLGFYDLDVEETRLALKVGLKGKLSLGRAFVLLSPSVFVGITGDEDDNPDWLWAPISLWVGRSDALALGVGSGIKGPLHDLAEQWTAPLGLLGTYAVSAQTTIGASWVFGKLTGAVALPDDATGTEFLAMQLWITCVR